MKMKRIVEWEMKRKMNAGEDASEESFHSKKRI